MKITPEQLQHAVQTIRHMQEIALMSPLRPNESAAARAAAFINATATIEIALADRLPEPQPEQHNSDAKADE